LAGVVSYPTLEHVAAQARPYPVHLFEGCETGLVLFAAAFLGHNDAIHFAEAGLRTTCVDIDGDRLEEMRDIYPSDWSFRGQDAFRFAELRREDAERWDVVSADPFTGEAMHRTIESLDLWCSLARKAAVVGITRVLLDSYTTPEGWRSSLFHRTNDIYWLVLERDADA